VLYTGERNHFLPQLPGIQEKLVDILRGGAIAPVVLSEVRFMVAERLFAC
jgi:hypothetical protein